MYIKRNLIFALALSLLTGGVSLQAQSVPNVQVRFANPVYDVESGLYTVDIQLKSEVVTQHLYSFNVRFFYDLEMMELKELSDFADHYREIGIPKSVRGDANSGKEYFSMGGAAEFVNTAVQLVGEESDALAVVPDAWVTAFKARFAVNKYIKDTEEDFCPSIIWDLEKPDRGRGGFLPNEEGVLFTVLEKDPSTPQVSAFSLASVSTFNWAYNNRSAPPYGIPISEQCVSLTNVITSINAPIQGLYKVEQNRPNPFDSETYIGFSIPEAKKVKLKVMDAAGRILLENTGEFDAGAHQIRIVNSEALFRSSQILFYQIETDDYISQVFKMNLLKR